MLPVAVIGAGPAGLAVSAELSRRGIEHRVYEQGACVGYSWTRLYDSLTLHTGKHLSALPGMPFPRAVPVFPTRDDFIAYLTRYARDLPVETNRPVSSVHREGDHWRLVTPTGSVTTRIVVGATGIIANPREPALPGRDDFRGAVLHSVAYRAPAATPPGRVLVVGTGNSGGEIASELAAAGRDVTLSVRGGAHVVPRDLGGVPIQYLSLLIRPLPRAARNVLARAVGRLGELRRGPPVLPKPAHGPLDGIPLIGFHLVDAIRAGRIALRGAVAGFTTDRVRFADGTAEPFDTVILATGFLAALGPFGDTVSRDANGFARRTDRVTSADHPNLYFVGQVYDPAGSLFNIARDARTIAARIAATAR